MITDYQISEPVLFNPLKHHLGFLREFAKMRIDNDPADAVTDLIKELKHIGTSVMDIYSGKITVAGICDEANNFLKNRKIVKKELFSQWAGTDPSDFRIIELSDGSHWTVKYHNHSKKFVHIFPARCSQHTFRIKATTLKTAILYYVIIGKDFLAVEDLNRVRSFMNLSPIKENADTQAIIEMTELLRG